MLRCLAGIRNNISYNQITKPRKGIRILSAAHQSTISIGNIEKEIKPSKETYLIPRGYAPSEAIPQSLVRDLQWILKKDIIGQDVFLIGAPGPTRRRLAFLYSELLEKEVEYIALTRDTTESDIKQRREIKEATAHYIDQSAVKAATEGRLLILDGIEKAERNVLPIINNLLENREMQLEDGRFLVSPDHYDKLLKEHSKEVLDKWKLVRVSEDFRVIALGLPVPKYRGNPLDPPLRSRFQSRNIKFANYQEFQDALMQQGTNIPKEKLSNIVSFGFVLNNPESPSLAFPDFPLDNMSSVAKILDIVSQKDVHSIINTLYPSALFLNQEGLDRLDSLQKKFDLQRNKKSVSNHLIEVKPTLTDKSNVTASFSNQRSTFEVSRGTSKASASKQNNFIATEYHDNLLCDIFLSHSAQDFCIIGPKGCGKTALAQEFARQLNYQPEVVMLYQDMTSRDLLQQRTTLVDGDTAWHPAPLVQAALKGKLAILDGIHRVHPGTLAVLHRLVHDREAQLYDGTRLVSADKFEAIKTATNLNDEELANKKILPIHPSFRIIALAEPPVIGSSTGQWLNPEILSLFLFHSMRPLEYKEELELSSKLIWGEEDDQVKKLLNFAKSLRSSKDPALKSVSASLSTRQIQRISKRLHKYTDQSLSDMISKACLARFLPPTTKNAFDEIMNKHNLVASHAIEKPVSVKIENGILHLGTLSASVYEPGERGVKVPHILFYNNPQHQAILEDMLMDFSLGEHLLLVGNQGVGKNKLVDYFLQLLNRPREYIQLHRDTSVPTLTLHSNVQGGRIIYEDSPLVRAVREGHILVIDEADKAPTHVTCILKGLVESGEMLLADGRRIIHPKDAENYKDSKVVLMHPDFRMIVLANRPGFPFLGNDFFGSLGDIFSCHAIDNPSAESEMSMLKSYGPNVPVDTLRLLHSTFAELRSLADQGLLTYPYSTRELVNIVKHLEKFPEDTMETVVKNTFDFDSYNSDTLELLLKVLNKNGIFPTDLSPTGVDGKEGVFNMKKKEKRLTIEKRSGKPLSNPKHGKMDPSNAPHVGGNTWAGGTGGRDTAGLGGMGGPYRLDAGHTVFQVSDKEKEQVPEHIRKAAREMAQEAYKKRLQEINMNQGDYKLYQELLEDIQRPVKILRSILETLQAKSKERQWLKHQTSGDLDDSKLVEGITGEKSIFRRRGEQPPEMGSPQEKPKRLRLLVDLSGSMYRFNGFDDRLKRQVEAVLMVMEAFEGHKQKFQYEIVGHSGDTDSLRLVDCKHPPENEKVRLRVLETMFAHTQYCSSGDNTLEGTKLSIDKMGKEEDDYDESFLIVLSDANFARYGIRPSTFSQLMTSNSKINVYAIFIGSLGDQAASLKQNLPAGRSFVCMDTSQLPQILQQIFTSSLLKQ